MIIYGYGHDFIQYLSFVHIKHFALILNQFESTVL